MELVFQEDNQAIIQILKIQKNPTLRHLNRTHRVNISWLCEVFKDLKEVGFKYCKTDVKWLPTSSPRLSLILLNGMQLWT